MRNRKCRDLTGLKIERLTIIEFSHIHQREETHKGGYKGDKRTINIRYWKCKCECGNERIVRADMLLARTAKECSECGRKRAGAKRRLPVNALSKNKLLNNYKRNAIKKNLIFDLSPEDFFLLTSEQCHYCGSFPFCDAQNLLSERQKRGEKGSYIYNGIDRIDSKKGYVLDNVFTCCKICNYAKNTLTLQEWENYLKKLIKFQLETYPEKYNK